MTIQLLRAHVVAQTLFPPTTLKAAIRRLGFVQADPIRSPARAHDLILRHRVKAYQAGDLERRYTSLDIEEDVLYAYGFLPRTVWRMLHPRNMTGLSKLEKKVYEAVCRSGAVHPREMEAHLGSKRVVNAWGGRSKATTRALEALHHRGLLRVARRERGIRVFEVSSPAAQTAPPHERLRGLIMAIADILAPVPQATLQTNIARYRRLGNPRAAMADLVREGKLEQHTVQGMTYIWPPRSRPFQEEPPRVRFLAPFDPVVWDRRRFEHLWGWPYRFEAYTTPAKRIRGYYAMPLLWGDKVIGWANAQVSEGQLGVKVGFVGNRPTSRSFRSELELEIERLAAFRASEPPPGDVRSGGR